MSTTGREAELAADVAAKEQFVDALARKAEELGDQDLARKFREAFTSPEAIARRNANVAKEHAKVERLRKKMIKAHPDAGGSHEAFIKARAAYEKARGWPMGGRSA